MFKSIIISILFNLSNFILTLYFVKSHFVRPMLERNNIVNKGLWIRNKADIKNPGEFIFRANSLDADSVLQNNFDAFGENNMLNSPFLTSYFERNKRSLIEKKQQSKETSNKCKNKSQCLNNDPQLASIVKSKFLSTLRPGSVFNEYPYAVATLINDNEKYDVDIKNTNRHTQIPFNDSNKSNKENNIKHTTDSTESKTIKIPTSFIRGDTNETFITPKRYKHSNEAEFVENIDFTKIANDTVTDKKNTRNVFDREDMMWQNSAPITDTNVYKTVPIFKENTRNKPITERGLIKVLTMMTKTFKKIMKQHNDIKKIHNRLYNLNDDFVKNVEVLTKKFEDFNLKYVQIMKANQELKQVETKLNNKEQYFLTKEREISRNIIEFESQQKKFLAQQKQFYDAQKVILAQNEKINLKQNVIAKTQSEIAHRQNNIARILKKAKQIYVNNKNVMKKLNTSTDKTQTSIVREKTKTIQPEYLTKSTTESVKINLFSIPTVSGIKNQDKLLLEEKDYHAIDDLIYKYYFNNTFIDDIMKNKILSSFLAASENTDNINKSKRNEFKLNTLLLPVNKTKHAKYNRERRWIKHSKKSVHKKEKTTTVPVGNIKENVIDIGKTVPPTFSKVDLTKTSDPYLTMTLNFCKEIGQDVNIKVLNWCVEKTLRRLQVMDFKAATIAPQLKLSKQNISQIITSEKSSTLKTSSSSNFNPTTDLHPSSSGTTEPLPAMFFPDNDELEDKLKEYELKPDTEGNVYYDGSLHSSDIGHLVKVDSEGFSDVIPGLESDSRVQVDPLAFDLQAQRRAEVRKINARIMKMRIG